MDNIGGFPWTWYATNQTDCCYFFIFLSDAPCTIWQFQNSMTMADHIRNLKEGLKRHVFSGCGETTSSKRSHEWAQSIFSCGWLSSTVEFSFLGNYSRLFFSSSSKRVIKSKFERCKTKRSSPLKRRRYLPYVSLKALDAL